MFVLYINIGFIQGKTTIQSINQIKISTKATSILLLAFFLHRWAANNIEYSILATK